MGKLLELVILISLFSNVLSLPYPASRNQPAASTIIGRCGTCGPGYTRGPSNGLDCGWCVPINTNCALSYLEDGNNCQNNGGSRFGTTCRRDASGEIVCDCQENYTGANCDQCAPGCVQTNQYPYQCIRPTVPTQCAGTPCIAPPPPPPPTTICPVIHCPVPVNPVVPCPVPITPVVQCPVTPVAPCQVTPSCPVFPPVITPSCPACPPCYQNTPPPPPPPVCPFNLSPIPVSPVVPCGTTCVAPAPATILTFHVIVLIFIKL